MLKRQLLAAAIFGRPEPHAWTNRTITTTSNFYALAYSAPQDRMVAVGAYSNVGNPANAMAYSDDGGKTWTAVSYPAQTFSRTWRDVKYTTYNGGTWVAVADTATEANLATSSDGITWSFSLISGVSPKAIHFDGTYFHIGCSGATYKRSTNLTSWTDPTAGPAITITGFAQNGSNRIVGVGDTSGYYSDDNGDNWTAVVIDANYNWVDVIYSTKLSLWIAVAESITAGTSTTFAATSATGLTGSWTLRTTHTGAVVGGLNKIAQANDNADTYHLCAVYGEGSTAPQIKTSTNGTSWTNRTGSITGGVFTGPSIAYSLFGENFCVVAADASFNGKCMTSTTGT